LFIEKNYLLPTHKQIASAPLATGYHPPQRVGAIAMTVGTQSQIPSTRLQPASWRNPLD
jgi:hypothetical protein